LDHRDKVRDYYKNVGRPEEYAKLEPETAGNYDAVIKTFGAMESMIALPFTRRRRLDPRAPEGTARILAASRRSATVSLPERSNWTFAATSTTAGRLSGTGRHRRLLGRLVENSRAAIF
jgi:hypothetical protein